MSKSGNGKNRVCLPCRIKYPSKFTEDSKSFNITSICSECSSELTMIHDSVRVPKKNKNKLWIKLTDDIVNKKVVVPVCKSQFNFQQWKEDPAHEALDKKLHDKSRRQKSRAKFVEVKNTSPDFYERVKSFFVEYYKNDDFSFYYNQSNKFVEENKKSFNILFRHYLLSPKDYGLTERKILFSR
jgi:hypothetical protein